MSVTVNQYPVPVNESYLNTSLDLGLEQLVDFSTRFNPDNTLDLLFTNRPSLIQKRSDIPGLSDHAAVLISTRLRPAKSKPAKRKILQWKWAGMASVRDRIDELTQEFHESHTTETPMGWLLLVHETAHEGPHTLEVDLLYIHKTVGEHHDKEAIQAAKEGSEEVSPNKTPNDLACLKKLQKAQHSECRKAYHLYLMGILDPDSGNKSKQPYSYVKSLKMDSCSVGPIRDKQGNIQSSAATQATLLNNQFASVFTSEDTTTLPELSPSPYPDMNHITIHTNGVATMLRHIKAHKATGLDEIPARLLKEAADQLAPMLTTIFQASYNQGTVPTAWLQADVVPVFKKGDPAAPSNYHPIFLTAICCKLMEHIMQSNIMHHLDSHSILNDTQHGSAHVRPSYSWWQRTSTRH